MDAKELLPTHAQIRSEVEGTLDWVQACLADQSDSWTPCLRVVEWDDASRERSRTLVGFAGGFDRKRYELLAGMGADYYRKRKLPLIAVLAVESWRSARTDCQPIDDPDRTEHMSMIGMGLNRMCVYCSAPISRGPLNRIVLGDPQWFENAESDLVWSFFKGFLMKATGKAKY